MDFGIKLLRFSEEILREVIKKPRIKRGFFYIAKA